MGTISPQPQAVSCHSEHHYWRRRDLSWWDELLHELQNPAAVDLLGYDKTNDEAMLTVVTGSDEDLSGETANAMTDGHQTDSMEEWSADRQTRS